MSAARPRRLPPSPAPAGGTRPGPTVRRRSAAAGALALISAAALLLPSSATADSGSPTAAGSGPATAGWAGSWGTAPAPAAPDGLSREGFDNRTVRMVVHTSIGGDGLRLRLSNAYGAQPLAVGRTTVALPASGSSPAAAPGSLRPVTFDGGAAATTLPAGTEKISDPVPFPVPAGANLLVSVHLPKPTGPATWHWLAQQRSYVSGPGDHAADPAGTAFSRTETSWFFLTGVDVQGPRNRGSVVALGDSQTDGSGTTQDGNARWTDAFARRLALDPATRGLGVVNKGLGGNRVLRDGSETDRPQRGTSALGRLDRDVIHQSGVRAAVLYEGVNDLQLTPRASADEVLRGLRTLAGRLRARGVHVVVGTLTPFKDSPLWTADAERARTELNTALRASPDFDAVADFDLAVRDPADPQRVRAGFDAGDHIHLNDAGHRALADAVPTGALSADPVPTDARRHR
ncbi:SGNH/GDSL hydrolase family protein [Streptomyces sp. NPDC020141]|uniref:SGNH/GDSL hydrolase family protein n=1 Tax=Streptomyces sp. NPDC020141 TaxID=3365065 RepID=UPI00379D8E69